MGRGVSSDADAVRFVGLTEFRVSLKALEGALPKAVSELNKKVGDFVVAKAKALADAVGGVAAKAAGSLRSSKAQSQAFVSLGGAGYDFALGAEFGAKHDKKRGTRSGPMLGWNQFEPWRGNQWQEGEFPDSGVGYFLQPAVRNNRDEIESMYLDGVEDISRIAFPD